MKQMTWGMILSKAKAFLAGKDDIRIGRFALG